MRVLIFAVLVALQASQPQPSLFASPSPKAEVTNKQAVVETSMGTFVIALLPEKAPNHVGYFIQQSRAGTYAGTTFFRLLRYGLIQGGDPLSKDPAKAAQYGTGGMNLLRGEIND